MACASPTTRAPVTEQVSLAEQATPDTSRLRGKTFTEIHEMLGEPAVVVQVRGARLRRAVWVYFPYPEDPTGLYLYFDDDRVVRTALDEFSGICTPRIQRWLQR